MINCYWRVEAPAASMTPALPKDGEFCQLFCFRIDMVDSERTGRELGPAGMTSLLEVCHALTEEMVGAAGGRVGGWQGDGAVAFFATTGSEEELIRRGEAAGRQILDAFAREIPDRRFRIGAATGRGRFWDALGKISEDCVVLAARLESQGRSRAIGSALLIPSSVHTLLEAAERGLYNVAEEWEGHKLFVYCPTGSTPIAPVAGGPATAPVIVGDMGFEQIDPEWPWEGKSDLYYAFAAWPTSDQIYDRDKHKAWIQKNYLRLPLGGQIFDDESLRWGWLAYYVAEKRDGEKVALLRFKRQGTVIFGDAGLPRLGGAWKTGFYPQAMLRPIGQFLEFIHDYYAVAHGYAGQVFVRAGVVNVAGRKRLLGEEIIGVRPFTYDQNLLTGAQFSVPDLRTAKATKTLYDELIHQSELDRKKFGAPA